MRSPVTPRRLRRLKIFSQRWQRRAIFTLGGFAVGLAAVALAKLADEAQHAFHALLALWSYASLIVTPLGFALAVYAAQRFFPNSQGSGIPQAIAACVLPEQAARERLVSLRIALGKIVLMLFGLMVGASTGREGPTVQVGASIMAAAGRLSPRRQPGLILAGAAAGVAAAFNTPLAGIVFGIEELSRSFEARTSGLIIAAVLVAGITSLALLGNYTYFGTTADMLQLGPEWLAVPACGVAGGLLGGLFARILIMASDGLPGAAGRFLSTRPIAFAGLCGLGVALCGIGSGNVIFGTGYEQARIALHATGHLDWSFMPLKWAATVLSSVSGLPGGIFSPSLAIGAAMGADISHFFADVPLGAVVLLGMVSYLTGVVQAPITGFVIVSELTDNHAMLVPLMATALIAQAVSRSVCREGVYHALAKKFLQPDGKNAAPPH